MSGDFRNSHSVEFLECLSPDILKRLLIVEVWTEFNYSDERINYTLLASLGFSYYDLTFKIIDNYWNKVRNHRTLIYKINGNFSIDDNLKQFSLKHTNVDEILLFAQQEQPYDLFALTYLIQQNAVRLNHLSVANCTSYKLYFEWSNYEGYYSCKNSLKLDNNANKLKVTDSSLLLLFSHAKDFPLINLDCCALTDEMLKLLITNNPKCTHKFVLCGDNYDQNMALKWSIVEV